MLFNPTRAKILKIFETIVVPVITLDKFILEEKIEVNKIGLIKVDVEGYEYPVIQGANKLLLSVVSQTKVLVEIHPDSPTKQLFLSEMASMGFDSDCIDSETFCFTKR